MSYGYVGRILHVDLSIQRTWVEEPEESFYRKYIGGSALAMYYMLKEVPPKIDAFDEKNLLIFSVGVTTGVNFSGNSRVVVTAKSPLTGMIGDSQSGGFWPAELKNAGYDAVIVRGRASKPVYLWIHDGEVEIRDAARLWGCSTGDCEDRIFQELGDKGIRVLAIGPAGEKMVRYSAVMIEVNRTAGRTGMGAVMGSKNLKAIAVRGHQRPAIFNPEGVKVFSKRGSERNPSWDTAAFKIGSSGYVTFQQTVGGLPSFNWNSGVMEGALNIAGDAIWEKILRGAEEGKQDKPGRDTCFACAVRCKRVAETKNVTYPLHPQYGGPEYESLAALGSYVGVNQLNQVAYANELCNRYGLDTVSAGATIAWAMECYEKGLINKEETGGIELKFGNGDLVIDMLERIAYRQGFGDILAEGSQKAADRLGKGHQYLVTVKGEELPAHMPHFKRGLGLIYAVNPFGTDHQSCEGDPGVEGNFEHYRHKFEPIGITKQLAEYSLDEEKVNYAVITQKVFAFLDLAALCQYCFGCTYQLYSPEEAVEIISAVTGWDFSIAELLEVGKRRINMMRAFNARDGVTRKEDRLPDLLFDRALKGGPSDGWKLNREEYERAFDMYYKAVGWDPESGNPGKVKLKTLGLDWIP